MPRKPPKGKSLAEVNPELAKHWHTSKNGDLTPSDFFGRSGEKVWWKCNKGDDHIFESNISNMSRTPGFKCSVCSGKVVVKSTCLATLHPELEKQWHPTKNGDLSPYDFSEFSNREVWWKCDEGDDHEWRTSIGKRTFSARNCPFCSRNKVSKSSSFAITHPELAKEWHPTKNGDLTPSDVLYGSTQEVWWKCPEGDDHEWKAALYSRSRGKGCSVCHGGTVVSSNCLATLRPEIAEQWHPTKNGDLTANDVREFSNINVWWKCPKGDDHEWRAEIANRSNGAGCNICSGHKVVKSNCLATTHPDLAMEWHPTKNGELTPLNFTAGSDQRIWWKCAGGENHEWRTAIGNRTKTDPNGCPSCAGYGFDITEPAVFYIRKVELYNSKIALKFGITNNLDGVREEQQSRHVDGRVRTIFKKQVHGQTALDIENLCKKHFGRKGYLTVNEFKDGFSETIKYSEESLNKIKSIVDEVLTHKKL